MAITVGRDSALSSGEVAVPVRRDAAWRGGMREMYDRNAATPGPIHRAGVGMLTERDNGCQIIGRRRSIKQTIPVRHNCGIGRSHGPRRERRALHSEQESVKH